ncbi:MAG: UvrD-helicase domain-containing protein [Myxococcota bacterium]|nr:UvrD-helicase domain-containing protein [Myxococcota bacterium]
MSGRGEAPWLYEGLNPPQAAAVRHREGPALVLAGAGSGKTRVLTRRVAALLESGVPAREILALTFTNRAAKEMRERVETLLEGESYPALTLTTFHALGARFLREHAERFQRSADFVIYDKDDQKRTLKAVAREASVSLDAGELSDLYEAIQRAKNAGHRAGRAESASLEASEIDVAALGGLYDEALRRADAFDFGDLIVCPARALIEDEQLRERYRRRWRWIMVDEFQDTNRAQYLLLQLLCPRDGNLFAVGDDDQSIYGWRGAEIENILHFEEIFVGAQLFRLEQNYRSKEHILRAANTLIGQNEGRLGKSLWTTADAGPRLAVYTAFGAQDEADFVARRCAALIERGVPAQEIAVLYRNNSLSLNVEQSLTERQIKYVILRGLSFFERAEIKDAVALLRLLVNRRDPIAFQRAAQAPSRGVGAATLQQLLSIQLSHNLDLFTAAQQALLAGRVKGRGAKGLNSLLACFDQLDTRLSLAEQARQLLSLAGLLEELDAEQLRDEQRRARRENLLRLIETIAAHEVQNPEGGWVAWLEQVKLLSEGTPSDEQDGGAVSLMTIHGAKGLEFPYVFVIGLEEGLFPHYSQGPALEEERRLFYVAITRAEERLYLSYARARTLYGRSTYPAPSRFLNELPPNSLEALPSGHVSPPRRSPAPQVKAGVMRGPQRGGKKSDRELVHGGKRWREGMRVQHRRFGEGELLSLSGALGGTPKARVRFGREERSIKLDFLTPL